MIVKCPQCVKCKHYELLTCEIHGGLKKEAYEDKCNDFNERLSDGGTFEEMFAEYKKEHPD